MNNPSKSKNDMTQKTGAGPGRPVAWMEVVGRDGERLNSFFSDLFGYETAEVAPGSHFGVMEARPHGIRGTLRSSTRSRTSKSRGATSSAWEGRGSPDRSIFPTGGPRQAGAGP